MAEEYEYYGRQWIGAASENFTQHVAEHAQKPAGLSLEL